MEEQAEYDQNSQNNNIIQENHLNNNQQINLDLMKRIELLDTENAQLKEAYTELQDDLKEKDQSIEESHKIISKLKDEYSKLIKEYQNLEQINKELMQESKYSKNALGNMTKINNSLNKLQKQNGELNNELIRQKNENYDLKNKIQSLMGNNYKTEEEAKNNTLIINDLNGRLNNLVNMIKDREKIISEQSKKINELNGIIDKKDEEIKILVNFSKQINKENKQNVKEITNQAIKTIKMLNHNRNNSYDALNNNNNIQNNSQFILKDDKSAFTDFIPMLKKNKTSFALKDAINSLLYIPDHLDDKTISKEFLLDMNFKTELLKSELFASLIRESKVINFLKDILKNLSLNDEKMDKNNENINNVFDVISRLKNVLNNIKNENKNLRKVNALLKDNLNKNDLLNQKIKDDVKQNMKKIKDKINHLSIGNPKRTHEKYNSISYKYNYDNNNNNKYNYDNKNKNSNNNKYNFNYNDDPNIFDDYYNNIAPKKNENDYDNYKNFEDQINNLQNEYTNPKRTNSDYVYNNYINSNKPKNSDNRKNYYSSKYTSIDNKKTKNFFDKITDNNKSNNESINDIRNNSYLKGKGNNLYKSSYNFNDGNSFNDKNYKAKNQFYTPNIDDKYISNYNNKYQKKKNSDNKNTTYQYLGKQSYMPYNQRKISSGKY